MTTETQQKIEQLKLLQQNVQQFAAQRQTFQGQLLEVESALEEMGGSGTAYKIVGNIMVAVERNDLRKELEEKQETLNIRVKTLEKQESKLQEKAEALHTEVMKEVES